MRTLQGEPMVTAPGKLVLLGEYAVLDGFPAIVAAVIMTSSKKRPAAVTGAPAMTSPTEPTSESPARRTTRPAAMATVGSKCTPSLGLSQ